MYVEAGSEKAGVWQHLLVGLYQTGASGMVELGI